MPRSAGLPPAPRPPAGEALAPGHGGRERPSPSTPPPLCPRGGHPHPAAPSRPAGTRYLPAPRGGGGFSGSRQAGGGAGPITAAASAGLGSASPLPPARRLPSEARCERGGAARGGAAPPAGGSRRRRAPLRSPPQRSRQHRRPPPVPPSARGPGLGWRGVAPGLPPRAAAPVHPLGRPPLFFPLILLFSFIS